MIKGKTAEKQRKNKGTKPEKKAYVKGKEAISNGFHL